MFCRHCGKEQRADAKFCHSCGNPTSAAPITMTAAVEPNPEVVSPRNSQVIIKCGNCAYEGPGETARSTVAQILAWLCIFFAPLITLIYFVATYKYRCPKCRSSFVGVKNKQGVFVAQTGAKRPIMIVILVLVFIAIIGLLSTLAVVALGSARIKARDARRLSDLKQIEAALELYKIDQNSYPAGSNIILGSANYSCLNANGWQPIGCPSPYMSIVPSDPNGGKYIYTYLPNSYQVSAAFEGNTNDMHGPIKLTPDGITQDDGSASSSVNTENTGITTMDDFKTSFKDSFVPSCEKTSGGGSTNDAICTCAANYLVTNFTDLQLTNIFSKYESTGKIPQELTVALNFCTSK